jgi:undecaprenyl diphosphate synthase
MHVAIIMDGNGRWDPRCRRSRTAARVQGADAVRGTVEAAARAGIDTLTLYAISAPHWARSPAEADAVLRLLRRYLLTETHHCVERGIRISVIGRSDWLGNGLLRAIEHSERLSAAGSGMHLRIVVDYSALDRIVQGAWRNDQSPNLAAESLQRRIHEVDRTALSAGAVDLLIRTGVEGRLSDFMLWEVAYAELYFTDCLWPDFNAKHFQRALEDYARRRSGFGLLAATCEDVTSPPARLRGPVAS